MSTIKLYTRTSSNSFKEYRRFEPDSVVFEAARPQCIYGQLNAVKPCHALYILGDLRSMYVSKHLDAKNHCASSTSEIVHTMWEEEVDKAILKIEECDEAKTLFETIQNTEERHYPVFYFGYNIEKDDTDLTVEDIA